MSATTTDTDVSPEPNDPEIQAAFEHHVSQAKALPEGERTPFRADAVQVLHNVEFNAEKIRATPPELDTTSREVLADYVRLGKALVMADRLIKASIPPGEIRGKLARGWELRGIALPAARACANAGLLPEHEVRDIEKGRGLRDLALDCVDLAALYRRYPVLLDKTPTSPEMVQEMGTLGTLLLSVLGAGSAKNSEPAQIRDALFTLLLRAHDQVWILGAQRWGAAVDSELRSLYAQGPRKPAKKAEPSA